MSYIFILFDILDVHVNVQKINCQSEGSDIAACINSNEEVFRYFFLSFFGKGAGLYLNPVWFQISCFYVLLFGFRLQTWRQVR